MELKISPEKLDTMIRHVKEYDSLPKTFFPTVLAVLAETLTYVFTAATQWDELGPIIFYYYIFSLSVEAVCQTYIGYCFTICWILESMREFSMTDAARDCDFKTTALLLNCLFFSILLVFNTLMVGVGAFFFEREYTVYFSVRMLTQVVCNAGLSYGLYIHNEQRYISGFGRSIMETLLFFTVEELSSMLGLEGMWPEILREIVITLFNALWMFFMISTTPFLDVIYRGEGQRLAPDEFRLLKIKEFWRTAGEVAMYSLPLALIFSSFSFIILFSLTILGIGPGNGVGNMRIFLFEISCGFLNVAPLSLLQTVLPRIEMEKLKGQYKICVQKVIIMITLSSLTMAVVFSLMYPRAAYGFLLHQNTKGGLSYDEYTKIITESLIISMLEQLSLFGGSILCVFEQRIPLFVIAAVRIAAVIITIASARLILGKRVDLFLILLPFELTTGLVSLVTILAVCIIVRYYEGV